jgi:hypothetical protein
MPDDSLLRTHARQHGLNFRWRTWREGAHWHAEARTWKSGETVAWFATTTIEGEQKALDRAMAMAIDPPRAGVDCGPINLADQRQQGKRRC